MSDAKIFPENTHQPTQALTEFIPTKTVIFEKQN